MMRQQAEENDNWPFEQICRRNCGLKRWIIECTLRSAHPVHDASTAWIIGCSMTHDDAWIGGELVERGHDFAFSDREKFRGANRLSYGASVTTTAEQGAFPAVR